MTVQMYGFAYQNIQSLKKMAKPSLSVGGKFLKAHLQMLERFVEIRRDAEIGTLKRYTRIYCVFIVIELINWGAKSLYGAKFFFDIHTFHSGITKEILACKRTKSQKYRQNKPEGSRLHKMLSDFGFDGNYLICPRVPL